MKRCLTCAQNASSPLPSSADAEVALDPLDGLGDAPIVEVDAVARDVADREPVTRLEIALRRARAVAEQRVVPVEALDEDLRDDVGRRLRRAAAARRRATNRRSRARPVARPGTQLPLAFSICVVVFLDAVVVLVDRVVRRLDVRLGERLLLVDELLQAVDVVDVAPSARWPWLSLARLPGNSPGFAQAGLRHGRPAQLPRAWPRARRVAAPARPRRRRRRAQRRRTSG